MSGNLKRGSFAMPDEAFERIRNLAEQIGCSQGQLLEALIESDDDLIAAQYHKVAPILEARASARKEKRRNARKALESLSPEEIEAILAAAKKH